MADPKNPFDFGTGSIDKDQWLKDIDNEQEGFVSQYANAANKHRTTLLRQAFQDLRNRIASGDMLSRTADGQYQFGSALISGDKHMQEAYQRALGFMGGLARRQINTPAPEPEKKSVGNIEERWIKSLNPSGNYNKTAYWKNQTDEDRKTNLINFLNAELTKVKNHEYNDYGGFTDEANLTNRLSSVLTALNSGKANDWTLQQLGFTKNWLQQPEEEKEEAPKSELEQVKEDIAKAEEAQQAQQGRQYLNWQKYKGNPQNWEFETKPYDYQGMFDFNRRNGNIKTSYQFQTPNFGSFSFTPFQDKSVQDTNKLREGFDKQNIELITDYLKNLGVNYSTMSKQARLGAMLGMLQSSFTVGDKTATPYASQMSKYFTPMQNGAYYINGSANKETGRYAFYTPKQIGTYAPGIHEVSILDLDDPAARQAFGVVQSNKQGGVIEKFDGGGEISDQEWANYLNKVEPKTTKPSTQTETVPQDTNEEMDFGDVVNIAGPLALDITSMITANGVGLGTALSAGSGIASTVWQGINDWDSNNVWGSLGSIGANLLADGVGLIPGLGISGKVGKIATGLAKHAKYLGLAFSAIGANDAAQVLYKGVKNGFNLSQDEWKTLMYGLAGVAQGGAGVKRANRVNLRRGAANKKINVTYDKKGKKHINVTDKLESENPIGTEATRYATTKESLIEARGATRGNRITSAPSKRFTQMLQQPKDNIILYPWETMQRPSIDLFGSKKINKTYEESLEWLKKKKAKRASASTAEPATEAPKERYGGILKALRNGGIIKAQLGLNGIYKTNGTEDVDVITNASNGVQDTPQYGIAQFGFQGLQTPEVVKVPQVNAPLSDQPFIPDWYMQRFNNSQAIKNLPELTKHTTNLKERQSGTNLDYAYFMNDAYANSGQANKQTDIQNYFNQSPNLKANNLQELITFYNNDIDTLYSPFNNGGFDYTKDDATSHNNLFKKVYGSRSDKTEGGQRWDIGWDAKAGTLKTAGSATHARRPVNYEKRFEDELAENPEKAKQRVAEVNYNNIKGKVFVDESGKLHVLTPEQEKALEGKPNGSNPDGKGKGSVVAEETELGTTFPTKIKNPFDPTLLLNSAKLATSLLGNADIYKNLLAEMPQAPLRDEIDRKLAIVGDQRSIDEARNKIADLRHIQRIQQGSDQQVNFASALEAERVGRDIMDNGLKNDALRQFDTAQKSWNIDNEDIMYNTQVGDANRRAIADRARMMAQIRAAYRNGNWNAIKNFVDDTSFWALKKYQTEYDLANKAKEVQLGTLEQRVDDTLAADSKYKSILDKYNAGQTISDEERAYIRTKKAEVLKQIRGSYASDYYNMYHDPIFGGGFKTMIAKNGGSLEKEKLKARSKDNDRYVSMIKDLRKTSYRRRRR